MPYVWISNKLYAKLVWRLNGDTDKVKKIINALIKAFVDGDIEVELEAVKQTSKEKEAEEELSLEKLEV